MHAQEIRERFYQTAVVPVVVIEKIEQAVPLAEAMLRGGVDIAEVTFRTACAAEAIAQIKAACPKMLVGAGTVVNVEQCKQALEAGAEFIVSPGTDLETVDYCLAHAIPVFPGAVTPTEIMSLLKRGIQTVKFFPAGNFGGLKSIKALSGPFPQLNFVPTGGVNNENLKEYLAFDRILAVGGSWMCPTQLLREGAFDEVTKLCQEVTEIVKAVRD